MRLGRQLIEQVIGLNPGQVSDQVRSCSRMLVRRPGSVLEACLERLKIASRKMGGKCCPTEVSRSEHCVLVRKIQVEAGGSQEGSTEHGLVGARLCATLARRLRDGYRFLGARTARDGFGLILTPQPHGKGFILGAIFSARQRATLARRLREGWPCCLPDYAKIMIP